MRWEIAKKEAESRKRIKVRIFISLGFVGQRCSGNAAQRMIKIIIDEIFGKEIESFSH
jgi:hypothetical protein